MGLALTRKVGQSIVIGHKTRLTVVAVSGGRVRLAFDAPPDVRIDRAEVADHQPKNSSSAVFPLQSAQGEIQSPLS